MYFVFTQMHLHAQARAEEEEVTSQINTDKAVHIIAPKMQLKLPVQNITSKPNYYSSVWNNRPSCMELSENSEKIYAPSSPLDDRMWGRFLL